VTTLSASDHVVVVGAGLAGWRFCEALRREGYDGQISLIGDEHDPPYDRPPLSKQVLAGKWGLEHTTLATPERLAEARVDTHFGVAASALDADAAAVYLADGRVISGTRVVVATGTRARTLAFSSEERIHTLRRRADARRLLDSVAPLAPGTPVVVIGGGFVGAEVATALHSRGLAPLVLEAAVRPLVAALGDEVSLWLAGLAGQFGVELRNDQLITDVTEDDGQLLVDVADASVRASVVVVAAGAEPNVEWLEGSNLTIDDGVVVNEHFEAAPRVAAIGDVARFSWPNVTGVEAIRVEHWQSANDHAHALAHEWVTGEAPTAFTIPYFWSDQYGKKIQLLGHPHASDDVTRVLDDEEAQRLTALYSRDGVVTGVVTLSQPRALMLSKVLLEEPTTLAGALERAPWSV
jgi:NADPH-dependent 2,4-dienoyl-CoA reductase/sulfur reductase-like enzyme